MNAFAWMNAHFRTRIVMENLPEQQGNIAMEWKQ